MLLSNTIKVCACTPLRRVSPQLRFTELKGYAQGYKLYSITITYIVMNHRHSDNKTIRLGSWCCYFVWFYELLSLRYLSLVLVVFSPVLSWFWKFYNLPITVISCPCTLSIHTKRLQLVHINVDQLWLVHNYYSDLIGTIFLFVRHSWVIVYLPHNPIRTLVSPYSVFLISKNWCAYFIIKIFELSNCQVYYSEV